MVYAGKQFSKKTEKYIRQLFSYYQTNIRMLEATGLLSNCVLLVGFVVWTFAHNWLLWGFYWAHILWEKAIPADMRLHVGFVVWIINLASMGTPAWEEAILSAMLCLLCAAFITGFYEDQGVCLRRGYTSWHMMQGLQLWLLCEAFIINWLRIIRDAIEPAWEEAILIRNGSHITTHGSDSQEVPSSLILL